MPFSYFTEKPHVLKLNPIALCCPTQVMRNRNYYISLCPDVPRQHGLAHRADESIRHMQQRRHHMTACSLKLSSLTFVASDVAVRRSAIFRAFVAHIHTNNVLVVIIHNSVAAW